MKISIPKIKKPDFSKIKSVHLRRLNRTTFLAVLSYISVLTFIPLIFSRKNSFIKFHAKQGIVLLVVWAVGMFSFYLPVLPYLFALFIAFSIIFGIVNVLLGRERPVLWVGRLADRI